MLSRLLLFLFILPIFCFAEDEHGTADRVVLVVWDGLRPDFVTHEITPELAAFAASGVTFTNNHPAYPSSTNVNGAVFATGAEPGRNGIIANLEFRPEIDPQKSFDTSDFPALDAPDGKLSAKYLSVPTIAELIQKAGFRTAIAGAKPVARLFDRIREPVTDAGKKSAVVYRGKIKPAAAEAAITSAIGPFPVRKGFPNELEDNWTTQALTEVLWKDDVPKLSVLWLSEPDLSQHATTLGSPTALAAMRCSDRNFGKVLAALRARDLLAKTDIFVASDHGFSTVDRSIDVAEKLRAAGFDAVRDFSSKPKPGQILAVSLGGSVEFYVFDRDKALIDKLITFLQRSDFASVIMSRIAHPGTFSLAEVQLNSPNAPDVLVACKWNRGTNKFAVAGQITSDIGRTLEHGTHSTLSPYDMDNTLIAGGPDFRHGWINKTPSGNIDLAPTILWILGVRPPPSIQGRILREAISKNDAPPAVSERTLEARCQLGHQTWRQHLHTVTVGGTTYLQEGDGAMTPTEP